MKHSQVILLSGPSGPVRVERDQHGVPHITAESLDDTHFGLGFCHARDRALQMLVVRTLGQGRACEQLQDTAELVELDRYFRRWNLCADAAREEAALIPDARAAVQSYCRGVNLYFSENPLPWELRLMRFPFEPWTVADTFLTAKVVGLVALAQAQADAEQFLVECVQNHISRERLEELFPGLLAGLDEELIRRVRLAERMVPESLQWASAMPHLVASNNWVVSGARTASGKPFLCNDPHVEINRFPAVWYEAALCWNCPAATAEPPDPGPTTPGADYAIGATFPGLPGVSFGRSRYLAWGITHAFMDCMDSWIEDCRDGKYRRGDTWLPFTVRRETIRRKKHPPLDLVFYQNPHGVLGGNPFEPGYYLATRWSCAEQTSADAMAAASGILRARTVTEGAKLLGQVSNCSWNWVLADSEGNIGYQMSGRMPIRRAGVSGLVPLPGWEPANDWQGFHPAEALPRAFNPPQGFLATANQNLNFLGKVQPINVCMADYRAQRINSVLAGPASGLPLGNPGEAGDHRDRFTLEQMRQLQCDCYSVQAEQFMAFVRPLLPEFSSTHAEAVRLLQDWDLCYAPHSQAAFLFEEFYRALMDEVFGKCQGAFGVEVLQRVLTETCLFFDFYGKIDRILLAQDSSWFGGVSRAELYRRALSKALASAPKAYGRTRCVRMRHLLFGGKLPLFLGFDRMLELPGNRATVTQGQIYCGGGREMAFAPSLRLVTDLATDEIQTSLAGGPSDRRFSKWYACGLEDWIAGRFKTLRA